MTDGSLDDRCDAKAVAVAMRSLSPARCLARFLSACRRSCRVGSLNGVANKACHCRRAMSPCPVVGRESCEGCVSSGSSRAEASFGSVVSGPAGQ